MLRHALATLAYRGGKSVRGAPPEFARYRVAPGTRAPVEILAHIGDLLDWTLLMADGKCQWHNSAPLPWDEEIARFFAALEALDRRLASGEALGVPADNLFQGPIADALTHVGQIAMLRNIAGCPMPGENYFRAHIATGRVGADQPPPAVPFD